MPDKLKTDVFQRKKYLQSEDAYMKEKLILHDLSEELAERLPADSADCTVFSAVPIVRSCIGCFGCWIKTPGRCVIKDRAYEFPELIAAHNELIIVSRIVFGGMSPEVKAVMDRSIGYMLPFFRIVRGEMHHVQRYEKGPEMKYIFYGEDIPQKEKEIAEKLIVANAANFDAKIFSAVFCSSPDEAAEVLM